MSFNSLTCDSIFGSLNWELAGCDLLISFPLFKNWNALYVLWICLDEPEITLAQSYVRYTHNTYPLINIPILFARLLDSDIENIGDNAAADIVAFFSHSISLDDLTSSQKEDEEKNQ